MRNSKKTANNVNNSSVKANGGAVKTPIQPNNSIEMLFKFQKSSLHSFMVDESPYFIAKDVCNILDIGNVTESLRNLDEDEKLTSVLLRAGQKRTVNAVSESGLYSLVFQSRKKEAKAFRKWVTSEVLPQIRKSGYYIPMKLETEGIFKGLIPIVINGVKFVCYTYFLRLIGLSTKSGAVSHRKKQHPIGFYKLFGRSFINEQMAKIVFANKELRGMRQQLRLDFEQGGNHGG